MMDCSSKLLLRTGDQLESVAKAEQDRQQCPHLQPVQHQANSFKAHLSTPWRLVAPRAADLFGRCAGLGHGDEVGLVVDRTRGGDEEITLSSRISISQIANPRELGRVLIK